MNAIKSSSLYTKKNAEELAKSLQESDCEGWTYTAIHDPLGTGYSYIEVRDENNDFVAKY